MVMLFRSNHFNGRENGHVMEVASNVSLMEGEWSC